jgi:hypothetical protein
LLLPRCWGSSALGCQLNQHFARGERFLSIELAFQ